MANSLVQLGIMALKAGRRKEARAVFEQVVLIAPASFAGWSVLRLLVDDDQEVLYCVRQVLNLAPTQPKALRIQPDALREDRRLSAKLISSLPSPPPRVMVSTLPTNALAGVRALLVTAMAFDQKGKPVADGKMATFSADKGEFSNKADETRSGIAQTILIPGSDTGDVTVKVECDGQTNSIKVSLPTNPSHTVKVSASPSNIVVGGAESTITVVVLDQDGNLVADGTKVTSGKTKGKLSATTVAIAGGKAQTELASEQQPGQSTVEVKVAGVSSSVEVTFSPGPPHAVKVSAAPDKICVGGAKSTITASVTDQYGNPVADGVDVVFSTTTLGTLSQSSVATGGGQGKAQTELASGQQPDQANVEAKVAGVSDSVDVTFSPGPPHAVQVSATPDDILVGGTESTITAEVADQYGNAVYDGTIVAFSRTGGKLSANDAVIAKGRAQVILASSNCRGQVTVSAQADSISGLVDVTFSPGPPHAVRISAAPDDIPVGGAKSTITAEVVDQYDNPVADGIDVIFTTTQGTLSQQSPIATSGGRGEAQIELISENQPGQATVSAKADGVSRSRDVTFSPGPPSTIRVRANPDRILIGGVRSTVTALVTDQYGNPVADGTEVRFSITRGCLYPTTVPTTAGRASTTFTSDQDAGEVTVTATAEDESGRAVSSSARITISLPDRLVRCLVCDHLVLTSRCPICGAENERWRELKHGPENSRWRGLEQVLLSLQRFPFWFLIVFALVSVVGVLALLVGFVLFPAGLSRFLWPAAILSPILSATIVVILFALRWTLRKHELLRQVRSKKGGPGLITMAALSFGLSVILSVGVAFLLWLMLTYSPQGTWTLKVRNLETGSSRSLLEEEARIVRPAWSPDGQTIVFASDQDGDWDVYALNADGTGQRNLTDNGAADFAPSWSQDGRQIVFATDRAGQWDIFVMDADGQNPRQVVDESNRASDPAWSPARQEVAYVLSSYVFSILLGDRVEAGGRFPVFAAVFYTGCFPFLTLALLLVGIKLFVNRLDDEFPRPIFLNTDLLTQIVLESVREHLRLHIDDAGTLVEPALLPIEMDAHELSRVTGMVIQEIERRLGIPVDLRGGLVLRSVGGRRGGGLGFLFERRDEPHWYWVESDEHGRISVLEEYPRVERMQLISANRTETGGLKMVVSRLVESEKKDKKVGEYPLVFEKIRYEVEANEWGRISSLKEQD